MTTNKQSSINDLGDQPVTQTEFSAAMTAIKQDFDRVDQRLDQMATKEDLLQIGAEMATKTELAELRQTTERLEQTTQRLEQTTERLERNSERVLDLIEGIHQQLKPLRDLPEDVRRLKEAVFH